MEYKQFSQKQQKDALESRQAQLEQEHFNNTMALAEAQAKGMTDDSEEVQQFAKNLEIIEQAHAEVTAQLDGAPTKPSGNESIVNVEVPEITPEEEPAEV